MTESASELDPEERDFQQLLAAVPPAMPPAGLREGVLRRVSERRLLWEWIVALLFMLPSAWFLVLQVVVHGDEFSHAVRNVVTAASGQTSDAFFFVDGLTVVALALLGAGCAVAAHAAGSMPKRIRR